MSTIHFSPAADRERETYAQLETIRDMTEEISNNYKELGAQKTRRCSNIRSVSARHVVIPLIGTASVGALQIELNGTYGDTTPILKLDRLAGVLFYFYGRLLSNKCHNGSFIGWRCNSS